MIKSKEEIKDLEDRMFQKVVDGEFIPDKHNICSNIYCTNCVFDLECDLVESKTHKFYRFKDEYPEFFI